MKPINKNHFKSILIIAAATLSIILIAGLIVFFTGYRYITTDTAKFSGWVKKGQPVSGTIKYSNGDSGELSIDKNKKLTIKYSTGDVYEGGLKGVLRHGYGKITYKDGNVYEGDFINDVRTGNAKITYADGSSYIGAVIDGIPHGNGLYTFADGSYYNGNFNMGKKDGIGEYRFSDGSYYYGTFVNDIKHGSEIVTVPLSDGTQYTGECTLHMANGDSYTGDYENDLPSGFGIFEWASGERYTGSFTAGMFNGQGTYTYADGTSITETFVNGNLPKKPEVTEPDEQEQNTESLENAGQQDEQ
ncbi:MAG: hypothetical protein E7600_04380 [Ruminococcaceae bacterium]|nr:hypothetical protein [Oscillospiraceae bacterium]